MAPSVLSAGSGARTLGGRRRLGGAEPGYGAVSHRLPKAVAGGRPSAPAVHAPEPLDRGGSELSSSGWRVGFVLAG